ncbi:MAG TPA: helix-turn-helix domain-containing protein, partial [Ktedonobacterales bacterium]
MAERTGLSVILKRYRVAAGLSQEALAERAELSARAISDLERGLHRAPHPSTIDLLAKALALTPQQHAVLLSAARPEAPSDTDAQRNAQPQRIPQPLTELIGRGQERDQARQLIRAGVYRLLTLTGPGGVGKTRLALAIAHDLFPAFAGGVIVVDLAVTRDEMRLPAAIAEAVGLRDQQQTPLADQLNSYLHNMHFLLVLDNFEHLLSQAPFVAQLLTHCPKVAVLATSRTALRVRGERQIVLEPLPLEDAVRLFRERAQEWQSEAAVSQEVIEAICQRVDCLPLGIELAAAQTRVATLSQTMSLLTNRLTLLRGGARDLPARQQTMEAAIAWSYNLLDEDLQRCFRALGVFAGGWTLEAAAAVCWEEGTVDMPAALLTLAALVDASLIQTETSHDGSIRFRMLEMTREFALARLEAAGEAPHCRLRHANYYATMAESITRFGPGRR